MSDSNATSLFYDHSLLALAAYVDWGSVAFNDPNQRVTAWYPVCLLSRLV
jgi:hypothetical protein